MPENVIDLEVKNETEYKKHGSVVIKMEHLKKSFGNNHVLRDINLVINKGENLAILGQSGTGKSVLIKSPQPHVGSRAREPLRTETS